MKSANSRLHLVFAAITNLVMLSPASSFLAQLNGTVALVEACC